MRLLLIRHGESTGNADGRLQGHLDSPLSERGRWEGERLAERLESYSLDALYSSTLGRARGTAEIVAARLGLELEERSFLMERDVGALAGLTRDEIRERFPESVRVRLEDPGEVDVDGYERDAEFSERAVGGLEMIVEAHSEQTVAVVTHGGVIGAYCRHTLHIPRVGVGPFEVSNAGITVFDVRDGAPDARMRPRVQLVTLNDTCHLGG